MDGLNEIDVEQLVAYEGYEYRVSNGKSGVQLNVKTCPNCRREDYKVYINAENGLGNCFGCSKTFNRFTFIKYSRGFTNGKQVSDYVKGISGHVIYKPKISPDAYVLNEDWKLPLNKAIKLEEDLPDYLKERKLSAKICQRFDIRICKYGFYKYNDFHGRTRFVDFSNRIIIPVRDINGELVTFQGRDMLGLSEKKYLFPNMLPGTGRYIYNADYVIKNKFKKVVLNEGAFDVFATTASLESDVAFKDYAACGTFGKNLSISATNTVTTDQLSDLFALQASGVEEFILMWDGEQEALKAALKAALRLNEYGLFTTVARLSDDLDPDEAGKEKVLKAIVDRTKPSKFDLMKLRLEVE